MSLSSIPTPRKRIFLPKEFKVTVWSRLKPYFNELLKREINSFTDLEDWLLDRSELSMVVKEDFHWRFIHMSADLSDEKRKDGYLYAVQEIQPKIDLFGEQLDRKLMDAPFLAKLNTGGYDIYLRDINNQLEIFNKDNVELNATTKSKIAAYTKLMSEITISYKGEELSFHRIKQKMDSLDRQVREHCYRKRGEAIFEKKETLDDIFDELLSLRNQIGLNAGMKNYRDYRFVEMNRFDYTAEDCNNFHNAIKKEVLPVLNAVHRHRRKLLNLDRLRPWDLEVDIEMIQEITLFEEVDDFVEKTIHCLSKVDPSFGSCLEILQKMEHLDLESRKNKRPGGYNISLPISRAPYIFMNATKSPKDIKTMTHEAGHAIHDFLMQPYELESARKLPFEVAELAAMTMELISMEHWDVYFDDPVALRSAKIFQLERIIGILPWIAMIDKFQHWIYTNPIHNRTERENAWLEIFKTYSSKTIDWTGLEKDAKVMWYRQMHIFNLPFYYIEYGIAQLGAIALWKQYRMNPTKTIDNFQKALKLGNTRTIKEIYETAGIAFDFSESYVGDLIKFVKEELDSYVKEEHLELLKK